MKYALQELVGFVSTHLYPAQHMRIIPGDERLQEWSSHITALCNEARLDLVEQCFPTGDSPSSSFSHFIEQYQRLLVQAMDMLYADKLRDMSDPTRPLREDTITRLDGIYQLLADSYQFYFHADEKLPNWRLDGAAYRLKCSEKKLRRLLVEKQVAGKLIEIVLYPYRSFMDKNSEAWTQCSRYVHYLTTVSTRIQSLLSTVTDDSNTRLQQLLLTLNFNHPDFIDYYYQMLTTSSEKNLVDLLPFFYECLNKLNRTICHPTLAYMPEAPPVKEEIINWLEQEINSMEKLLRLGSQAATKAPGEHQPDEEDYEILGVSVDLYSAHKRVERMVGMLANKNQTKLCNSIARNCRRKDLQPVAAHSFRQSYYSPTRKTIDDLQEYYKKMILTAGQLR